MITNMKKHKDDVDVEKDDLEWTMWRRVEDVDFGVWRMCSGGRRVESGECVVEGDEWRTTSGVNNLVVDLEWRIINWVEDVDDLHASWRM